MSDTSITTEPVDDLHGDIAAAFEPQTETPVVEPAVAAPVEPVDGKSRDEQGRFVPKTETAAQTALGSEPAAQTQAASATVAADATSATVAAPPPGWSVAAKTAFAALPAEVKEAVVKREQEVNNGFRELQDLKDIKQAIAPHTPMLTMKGVSPAQAFTQLMNAQAVLDRDPVNGIAWLARSYGVDLRQFGAQNAQAGPGHQAPNPIEAFFKPIVDKVTALESQWQTREQQAEQHQRSQVEAEITAFRADPKHVYLDNVSDHMAVLIQTGQATDLKDAYDKACWSHPQIRAALINEQQVATSASQKLAATAAVQNARRAAGSLAGAPTPGAVSGVVARPDSIEGDLRAAFDSIGARV